MYEKKAILVRGRVYNTRRVRLRIGDSQETDEIDYKRESVEGKNLTREHGGWSI